MKRNISVHISLNKMEHSSHPDMIAKNDKKLEQKYDKKSARTQKYTFFLNYRK